MAGATLQVLPTDPSTAVLYIEGLPLWLISEVTYIHSYNI